ncbi:MAG: 30S ribosomal protein S2 [Gemmatimonadales bacterium]|nr:30S ribosomal protein S2 [Candidatus Palauibacter irciniicola]MYC17113.1 30S ribosomal protein S2 [Gemmatimonadales bacterium]
MGVELQDLLKAGVHFGHQTHRWNPKMRKYIFAECGGIYLIDLKKTQRELERAHELVRQTIVAGKSVLFVCTKSQLARVVRGEAERCGSFYVTERWLGGMLTNFQTIKKNIARLKELERGVEEGAFEFYTKKERLLLEREREKLDRYLSGIKEMTKLPGLVFVVDSTREDIAVREANRLGIPVVAIADTNADPDLLTIAIAGNDDAIRSVSLITRSIADVVEASRREIPEAGRDEAESQAYTYSSDAGGVADAAGSSRRRRPRRKPRPEVIAQRLHHPAVIESADGDAESAEGADEGAASAESAESAESDAKAEAADNPEPAADAGSEDAETAVVGEVESEEK